MALIEPRTLKGFRDYLPEQAIPREALIETARRVFRSYGFLPIDTPALEYEEILTGKGGEESDKQLYRFEDSGGRKVALRFDLTVPLARFVAQHSNELGMPFKRYHIATVWRGENTQRGRYREFMQCDFDTIGTESMVADVETILVIHDLLRAIGIERFTIRVNDRKYLTAVLDSSGFPERHADVLRVLDKRDKVGVEGVVAELQGLGFDPARVRGLLARLDADVDPSSGGRLLEVRAAALAAGVDAQRIRIDPSIARGLDYYTGIVFETRLDDQPEIGSVCSGGRYDDLAQLYTKERLPGVGASLGLDRLLAAIEAKASSATARVFLPYFDASRLADYLRLAAQLRSSGVGVELYPEPKKLGAQLKYADRRGFKFALVLGEDEWKSGTCQLKDLGSATTRSLPSFAPDGKPSAELLAALR
jgi:histidyl-tRNA synthetase